MIKEDVIVKGMVNASDFDNLQDAINAAGGIDKYLWIPTGIYEITSPLSFPNYLNLRGAGKDNVIIKATSSMNAVIDTRVSIRHLKVGGFTLDGNNLTTHGLFITNTLWFSTFEDIVMRNYSGSGLYLSYNTTLGTAPYWNTFINIQPGGISGHGTQGISLVGDVNLNTFINVKAKGSQDGVKLCNNDFGGQGVRAPNANVFIALDCEGTGGYGVWAQSEATMNSFLNPYMELSNISMRFDNRRNSVLGGNFYGNTTNHILMPDGLDCYYYRIPGVGTYGSWLGAPGGLGAPDYDSGWTLQGSGLFWVLHNLNSKDLFVYIRYSHNSDGNDARLYSCHGDATADRVIFPNLNSFGIDHTKGTNLYWRALAWKL